MGKFLPKGERRTAIKVKLKTLGTGSTGNCYLLTHDGKTLVLDCGVSVRDIKIGLDFDLSGVQGVLVTHKHSDHAKSAEELRRMGIRVWQPYLDKETIQRRSLGEFLVKSFKLPHDGTECCGFLVQFGNDTKLLYATDFEYIPYNFKSLQIEHFLIEMNYDKQYISEEAKNSEHVYRGHAEKQTTLDFIKANMTERLKSVTICHMSYTNADVNEFLNAIKGIVGDGVHVYYAQQGEEHEWNE